MWRLSCGFKSLIRKFKISNKTKNRLSLAWLKDFTFSFPYGHDRAISKQAGTAGPICQLYTSCCRQCVKQTATCLLTKYCWVHSYMRAWIYSPDCWAWSWTDHPPHQEGCKSLFHRFRMVLKSDLQKAGQLSTLYLKRTGCNRLG